MVWLRETEFLRSWDVEALQVKLVEVVEAFRHVGTSHADGLRTSRACPTQELIFDF